MKMFRRMGKKLNNKGLSLVEVIIAVVILAAVVAPTLRLFASSAGYNNRSRAQQRAIAVAESTMESFKAYDIEELCIQFGEGTFDPLVHHLFEGVSYDSTTTRSVTAKDSSNNAVSDILDANNKLNDAAINFTFKVENAVEDGYYYDVEVLVSKNTESPVLKMDAINAYTDAVVQLPESDTSSISTAIYGKAQVALSAVPTPSDIVDGGNLTLSGVTVSEIKREITLAVSHDNTTGAETVDMSILYRYKGTYDYQYVSKTTGVGVVEITGNMFQGSFDHEFDPTTGTTTKTVYDNSATIASEGGNLKNLYFYYYPMYEGAVGALDTTDIIKIDGSAIPAGASNQVQVHIAKQKATGCLDTVLETYESGYKVDVTGSGNVALYSNLDKCLTGANPTMVGPAISGFSNSEDFLTGTEENKGLLYNVEVKVYNAGETDVLATFIGTMNN